jgi:peptidoglycan hydrolase CwlO-like protein
MKLNTRKYLRILEAQSKLQDKIGRLSCTGSNWQKEREQVDKLESKINDYEAKLSLITPLITEEEFNEHLSDIMCLQWEDFE